MIALIAVENVNIHIAKGDEGLKLWITVDSKCVCRVYKIKNLDISGLAHLEKVE